MKRKYKKIYNFILALIGVAVLIYRGDLNMDLKTNVAEMVPGEMVGVELVRVIDGDTIVVKRNGAEEKVRMLGIDAPEIAHPEAGSTEPGECYGEVSTKRVVDLLGENGLYLEQDIKADKKDRYGRTLAYLIVEPGKENVSRVLITEGLAKVYLNAPFSLKAEFLAKEEEAKQQQKGLWDTSNCPK